MATTQILTAVLAAGCMVVPTALLSTALAWHRCGSHPFTRNFWSS